MAVATLASDYVTDTIGLVLRVEGRRLGSTARAIFEAAEAGTAVVHVPVMVFAEVLYLSEKRRIRASLRSLSDHLRRFPHYKEFPMSLAVVQAAAEIADVPELHDRLVAGVARLTGLELITNDVILQASTSMRSVW